MDKALCLFALHCTFIVQGNTTLAKSQILLKYAQSGPCPLMGNWQTLEYSMVLTKYFHSSSKVSKIHDPIHLGASTTGKRLFYAPPQGRWYTIFFYLGKIKYA